MVQTNKSSSFYAKVRAALDSLYRMGGILAALCLIAILLLILIQMVARWTGEVFVGAPDYAGYCMAAASFFAFAYALNHGAHIRVSIVLHSLGKMRRYGEIWCFAIGSVISTYFCWYAIKNNYWSWKLNDISQGQDALPIWIPQLPMSIGTILLAICFWDNLFRLFYEGDHNISSEAIQGAAAE